MLCIIRFDYCTYRSQAFWWLAIPRCILYRSGKCIGVYGLAWTISGDRVMVYCSHRCNSPNQEYGRRSRSNWLVVALETVGHLLIESDKLCSTYLHSEQTPLWSLLDKYLRIFRSRRYVMFEVTAARGNQPEFWSLERQVHQQPG